MISYIYMHIYSLFTFSSSSVFIQETLRLQLLQHRATCRAGTTHPQLPFISRGKDYQLTYFYGIWFETC